MSASLRIIVDDGRFGHSKLESKAENEEESRRRFWILSNLCRARSNKTETLPRESCEEPSSLASPPPSWFSTILPARRHTDRRRRINRIRDARRNLRHGGSFRHQQRIGDRGWVTVMTDGKGLMNMTRVMQIEVNGKAKGKNMTLHGRCQVFKGKSSDRSELLFSVKRSSMIQSGMIKLEVFLANNRNESFCDFRVNVCRDKSFCTIYAGESPTIVASMANNGGFNVLVHPTVDYAFIVALLMIINEMKHYFDEVMNLAVGMTYVTLGQNPAIAVTMCPV
ncbi:LURP1 protein [Spatholobus suberectus]|nr:LURP1 protein [Spatholobus suberectus]